MAGIAYQLFTDWKYYQEDEMLQAYDTYKNVVKKYSRIPDEYMKDNIIDMAIQKALK
jgi:hypothetical protein